MSSADALPHTVVRHGDDGQIHVQHFGEAREVPGSSIYIDVPIGTHLVIRHVPADTPTVDASHPDVRS